MKQEDRSQDNPFRVPENYFDEVNRKIFASTIEAEKARTLPRFRRFRPLLAIAASVAVLVTTVYFPARIFHTKNLRSEVTQLITSSPEILIDEIDIVSLENSAAISVDFEEEYALTNEEIINYLLNDHIEISMIYEKF